MYVNIYLFIYLYLFCFNNFISFTYDVDETILKNYFEKLFWKYYFYLVFSK